VPPIAYKLRSINDLPEIAVVNVLRDSDKKLQFSVSITITALLVTHIPNLSVLSVNVGGSSGFAERKLA